MRQLSLLAATCSSSNDNSDDAGDDMARKISKCKHCFVRLCGLLGVTCLWEFDVSADVGGLTRSGDVVGGNIRPKLIFRILPCGA